MSVEASKMTTKNHPLYQNRGWFFVTFVFLKSQGDLAEGCDFFTYVCVFRALLGRHQRNNVVRELNKIRQKVTCQSR